MSLRLQHLQWIAGVAIALCCLALGGMSLLTNLDAYRREGHGVQEFERFRLVLDAMNAVSFERGPAQQLMAGPLGDEVSRSKTAAARRETDARLALAEGALSPDRYVDEDLLTGIARVRARLSAGRARVDGLAQLALHDRDLLSVKSAVEAMFVAFDDAEQVRDKLGQSVVRLAPEIAREVFLCLSASGLREHAGRLGAYVMMGLKAGSTVDTDSTRQLMSTVGRLKTLHRAIETLAGSLDPEPQLTAALAEVQRRFFAAGLPRAIAVARAASAGNPMNVTDFTRGYQHDLRPSHDLRDIAAQVSQAKLERLRDEAFNRVLMSGGLTLLVFLTMVPLALVFRRSLFRPLLEARAQIVAIAKGDLSDPKVSRDVSPEIDEMLAGLDFLRREQRSRRRLEEDQRRMSQQLKLLSETDMLTGLLNRRALEDAATRAFAEAEDTGHAVGVILFDLDHFKSINDNFGHAVGDAVLLTLSSELRKLLRPGDAFARFGGEEFIVLLPRCEPVEAALLAKALHRRLGEIDVKAAPGLRVAASFGVATRDAGSGLTWKALLGTADRRLYAAKRAGRNRVFTSDRRNRGADAA